MASPTALGNVCFLLLGLLFLIDGVAEDGIWRIVKLAAGGFLIVVNGIDLFRLVQQRDRR